MNDEGGVSDSPSADPISPDSLLATKLFIPAIRRGYVSRPRLIQALDERVGQGVILVSAPAGFGKSSLVADWARSGDRAAGWLSLDSGDNDPVRFWRYLIVAFDTAHPGLAGQIGPVGQATAAGLEATATKLINVLAAADAEVLVVFDDYHLIESDLIHRSVTYLLEQRPPGLRVVLASRSDPLLPLGRLRARGSLAELRAADLRFTAAETAQLISEWLDNGTTLTSASVQALTSRTEGWVAGLQLAALSLQGRSDIEGRVDSLSGSHRYIFDFLTEEVLERQPEGIRRFLLDTSILDRLSADLCDAVMGGNSGREMLGEIERSNLFLIPLDDDREWWRYHHLFADVLRAHLEQENSERVETLHRKAGFWCERHGLADQAIRHALAAGDENWAARLIEQHVDELFLASEGTTLDRWMSSISTDVQSSRPRLLLAQARLDLQKGNVLGAEAALDATESALTQGHPAEQVDFQPSVGRESSLLANVAATLSLNRAILAEHLGNAEKALLHAKQARTQTGTSERILDVITQGHVGIAQWMEGRLEDGEASLRQAVSKCRSAGEAPLAAWASFHLGSLQRVQGRLDAALDTYRQSLQETITSEVGVLPAAGVARVGMAAIAYERNALEDGLQHAVEGIYLCRRLAFTPPLVDGLVTLAWIRWANGDTDGAVAAMGEAADVAPDSEVVGLLNPLPTERARLLLALGDTEAVASWVDGRDINPEAEATYARESEYLVYVRLLLAQNRPSSTLGLLERLKSLATRQGRRRSLIEILTLQALAEAATSKSVQALTTLAEALQLAGPQNPIRVFVEGPPMADLLSRLVSAQRDQTAAGTIIDFEQVGRIAQAFTGLPRADSNRDDEVASPLLHSLSQREVEVLALLASGKSNRQIADELYVAIDTVKKHVTHILDKLGATNRTEASSRARQLGLLPDD